MKVSSLKCPALLTGSDKSTLLSMALGRTPSLIQEWTSTSSSFCPSEKRGWFFCSCASLSLSSFSTVWMSLHLQDRHILRSPVGI